MIGELNEAMPSGHRARGAGALLAYLADRQADTAPVALSIGWTGDDGQVRHGYVVIRDAPPRIVQEVIRLCPGASLVEGDGLVIHFGS